MRSLALIALFALMGAAIGYPLAGPWGAALGGSLLWIGLALLGLLAEIRLRRTFPGVRPASLGVHRSYQRVLEIAGLPGDAGRPELLEAPGSAPLAFFGRSTAGNGVIVVYQGLVALLSEEELRAVLLELDRRVRSQETPLKTLCALLATDLLSILPRGWTRFLLVGEWPRREQGSSLSPQGLLAFALGYPWVRLLTWFCGPGYASPQANRAWESALRKIRRGGADLPAELSPALAWVSIAVPVPVSGLAGIAEPCL